MTQGGSKVEFENDRVRVSRVTVGHREKHPRRIRKDRVLVWLTDSHETRTGSDGKQEDVRRKAGDVAWREASEHQIENLEDQRVELVIVELKD
jgi:hypothetical protein